MIPVQNIYYMLSYAFQALQAQNYKALATENFHNTAELCAAILDKGISVKQFVNAFSSFRLELLSICVSLYLVDDGSSG